MSKKAVIWIIIALIILQLPLTLFLLNSKAITFDIDFYEDEFKKYNPNVTDSIPITKDLISFLRYRKADTSYIEVFEKEEIEHLIDVKWLFQKSILTLNLLLLSIIFLITALYFFDKKKFLRNLSITAISGGILTLVLTFTAYLTIKDFENAFTRFHHVFFKIGTWDFPPNYKLVTLFPQEFWISAISKILSNTVMSANILILVGILIILVIKKKKISKKRKR